MIIRAVQKFLNTKPIHATEYQYHPSPLYRTDTWLQTTTMKAKPSTHCRKESGKNTTSGNKE